MAILPPDPPATNSSFHMLFHGPSLQCDLASSSQQSVFDQFAASLANDSEIMIVTKRLYESGRLTWLSPDSPWNAVPYSINPVMNVYSAFSPYSGQNGWLGGMTQDPEDDSYYNNFVNVTLFPAPASELVPVTQQIWIQTSDRGIVCNMINASFDVTFEFVNIEMTKAEYTRTRFQPFLTSIDSIPNGYDNSTDREVRSYMAIYLALSAQLNGNITTTLTTNVDPPPENCCRFDGNASIYASSSRLLQTGLPACDEIVHNYVSLSLPPGLNLRKVVTLDKPTWICDHDHSSANGQFDSLMTSFSGVGMARLESDRMDQYHGGRQPLEPFQMHG